ncbi:f73b7325-98f3-46ea-ad06-1720c64925f3 [Thermothielavioides terrestris]|uniref:F73b7325-98f3-46ea-ad06-1720c64925f3 n=1 Tax=Thermothielavioides terrestris TaxID=2587410 RepID=A0A3S5CW91_9PEZI|nr:f73b7325-98f3-46ea-ad06-1720c64925f3 [Thermothielavioides terrestris]
MTSQPPDQPSNALSRYYYSQLSDLEREEALARLHTALLARPAVAQPPGALRGAIGSLWDHLSQVQDSFSTVISAKNHKIVKGGHITDGTWDFLYGYQPTDAQVVEKFKELRDAIEKFASKYFLGGRKSLLAVKMKSRCWEALESEIFCAESPYWAGQIGADMATWFRDMKHEVEKDAPGLLLHFHEQRARMATLLERFEGRSSAEKDARVVAAAFGPYITARHTPVDKRDWESLLADGLNIVHKAADLDLMFRRSVADYGLSPDEAQRASKGFKRNARFGICHFGLYRDGRPLPDGYDTKPVELVQMELGV